MAKQGTAVRRGGDARNSVLANGPPIKYSKCTCGVVPVGALWRCFVSRLPDGYFKGYVRGHAFSRLRFDAGFVFMLLCSIVPLQRSSGLETLRLLRNIWCERGEVVQQVYSPPILATDAAAVAYSTSVLFRSTLVFAKVAKMMC